MVGSVKSQRF